MSEAGVSVDVRVDDQASREMRSLAARIANLGPALDEIGASNVTEVQHRFESEKDPEGNAWQPLAAYTLEQRGPNAKILRDQANLYDSVVHQVGASKTSVQIGSNRKYARIHQLGGKAGRGRKVEIPARPYLGVSKEGQAEIIEILKDHAAP